MFRQKVVYTMLWSEWYRSIKKFNIFLSYLQNVHFEMRSFTSGLLSCVTGWLMLKISGQCIDLSLNYRMSKFFTGRWRCRQNTIPKGRRAFMQWRDGLFQQKWDVECTDENAWKFERFPLLISNFYINYLNFVTLSKDLLTALLLLLFALRRGAFRKYLFLLRKRNLI